MPKSSPTSPHKSRSQLVAEMTTTLVYVPATRRMVPVTVPERIMEARRPVPPQPLEQQTTSRYHHLFGIVTNLKQHITTSLNYRYCALYQLPDELHIMIAQHLSNSDLLSYATCSQRTTFLRHHLQPPLRFRICEHKSYSPQALERAMWTRPQHPLRAALCPQHHNIPAGILGPELAMVWEQGAFVALVFTAHFLCQTPRDPARAARAVRAALEELAVHICPHVNSADEVVWDELKSSLGRLSGEVVGLCHVCGAEYGFCRRVVEGALGVVLNVQRRVRGLEDPDSPGVRVNLEDCSPVVPVCDGVQREEPGIKERVRGWVEWMLGLVVGVVILGMVWNWSRNLPVRGRVMAQHRGHSQGDENRKTAPRLVSR